MNDNCIFATSRPPCRREIPIFPVRYAIMPSGEGGYEYPKESALQSDFPALKHSRYCLRTLRQASYIYLYDENAPYPWRCFYYGEKPLIAFYQLEINQQTGALKPRKDRQGMSYIVVDNHDHNPSTIHLCYTDTPLSENTLRKLEDASQRDILMQALDIGLWSEKALSYWNAEKQALPKDKIPHIPHTFHVDNITDQVLDYYEHHTWYGQTVYRTDWSEEDPENQIHPNDAITHPQNSGPVHLCFALYDAVGIASELSHLVGYEVAKFNQFIDVNARKVEAMRAVKSLTKQAGIRAYRGVKNNAVDEALFNSSAISGGALNDAHRHRKERQKSAEANKRHEFSQYVRVDEFSAFEKDYPKQLEAIKTELEQAGKDHVTWLENLTPSGLYFSLNLYDAKDIPCYIGLREAVARSTMALPATSVGIAYGESQLNKNEAVGIFHQALMGNPHIQDYIEKTKTIGFVGTNTATTKLNALTALINEIPPDKASHTLAGVTITLLLESKKITQLEPFETSRYLGAMEAMEGVMAGKKSIKLEDFAPQMREVLGTPKTKIDYKPTTVKQALIKDIKVYHTIDTTLGATAEEKQQKRQLLKKSAFWSNIKIGASSLGLFLGTYSVLKALDKLDKEDQHVLVNSLGLSSSLFNLGAATSATAQAVYGKRATLASIDEKKRAFKAVEDVADKTALFLLIGAAIMAGAKNAVMVTKTNDRRQVAYLGAFGAHLSVATVGTYHLLTKVAQTSPTAAKAVSAINATRVGKVLSRINPYAGLALLIGEAIAFGLEKYAEAQADEKVLDWIEQSIWGIKPNPKWNAAKEQYALNDLFMKPKVSTDFLFYEGDNYLTVLLPGYKPQVSAYEVIDDGKNISKKGRLDIQASGAILTIKDVDWIGKVEVSYWPDKFSNPEIKYKATD